MADVSHLHHVKHALPAITLGVSYMSALIYSVISFLAGFGLGWYVKGRGMAGVKIDLDNVKKEVASLKATISAPVAPAV